mgnify:CR=1 FL=1
MSYRLIYINGTDYKYFYNPGQLIDHLNPFWTSNRYIQASGCLCGYVDCPLKSRVITLDQEYIWSNWDHFTQNRPILQPHSRLPGYIWIT